MKLLWLDHLLHCLSTCTWRCWLSVNAFSGMPMPRCCCIKVCVMVSKPSNQDDMEKYLNTELLPRVTITRRNCKEHFKSVITFWLLFTSSNHLVLSINQFSVISAALKQIFSTSSHLDFRFPWRPHTREVHHRNPDLSRLTSLLKHSVLL